MPNGIPALTLRQQTLLGLVCLGASDAQLCRVLHVERPRLYRQLHRLMQVLGCRSREELVAWVHQVPRPHAPDPLVQYLETQDWHQRMQHV